MLVKPEIEQKARRNCRRYIIIRTLSQILSPSDGEDKMGRESSTHRDFRYAQSLLVEKREAKRRIAKPELDGTTLLK
jgi:hypothetical protein